MPRTAQVTQVGRRRIEVSNLEKVLFPDEGIIKAELIDYYLRLAPTLLRHIKGRPLSFVRYPDGAGGPSFFQKNRPEGTPAWVESVQLGDEDRQINYVLATEQACLVWTANLACIELHQIHARAPRFDRPDYIVWDFDPPEDSPFGRVRDLAVSFRGHLEGYGYSAFVKTTGRKGLHVVAPVEPEASFDEAFEAARDVAAPFVANHEEATLHIKKEARKGRILVDVYRNRPHQTILSAYSVRGIPGAPVSTPLTWDELEDLEDPAVHRLRTVVARVLTAGDPWEAVAAYAVPLHTRQRAVRKKKPPRPSRTHKTPEALAAYAQKRDFASSPEPPPGVVAESGRRFVVHRHHASRLHYDLRLERDGSLQSWAVPKGLPPRPGLKRLAVRVEDHPVEYLGFEGRIPKGEYGAGPMWTFARGTYDVTKEKRDSFYVRLHSRELNAEYRLIHTRDKEWLLERVDTPQVDWLSGPMEPMLAESADAPPPSDDYLYEVKWDGIRVIATLNEGALSLWTRSRRDITVFFPEFARPDEALRATSAVLDGEIVCLDAKGRPVFHDAVSRIQKKGEGAIRRAAAKNPAICCLFDCLYLDGRPIVDEPLVRRREWLADVIKKQGLFRLSDAVDDGPALFDAARGLGLEGIVAKVRDSPYRPGRRSAEWLKIKVRRSTECVIVGYTKGKGGRGPAFGALQLARQTDGRLEYAGKVGTGFDDRALDAVRRELDRLSTIARPVATRPIDDKDTVWVEPALVCEVQYASITKNGTLREPVFLRLRPDLST